MRRLSLLHGAINRQPRSLPSSLAQSESRGGCLPHRTDLREQCLFSLSGRRVFHSSHQHAGVASDIYSAFAGSDDGAEAKITAMQSAKAKHDEFSKELNGVNWMHAKFKRILREGHPDRVLHALRHETWGPRFLSSASPTLFAGALARIPPSHFLDPYVTTVFTFTPPRSKLRAIVNGWDPTQKPELPEVMGEYRVYHNLHLRFKRFSNDITDLFLQRQQAGHPPVFEQYVYLLDMARKMGDEELADQAFDELKDEFRPDDRCYNYYMEARAWAGMYDFYEHDKLRVERKRLSMRSSQRRPLGLRHHKVGRRGLREDIVIKLDEMVNEGYVGSEETFSHVITAMGREGDMIGLKSVLKSVWNIDVDLMEELDEEEIETPTYYEKNSPLRPTFRLLSVIAHAYVINQEPFMGLKVVDYISRQYDMSIPLEVWRELLTGTFLQTVKRSSRGTPDVLAKRLPTNAFVDLWALMVDKPHNIIPDESMYILRRRLLRDMGRKDETFKSIAKSEHTLNARRSEAYKVLEEFIDCCQEIYHSGSLDDDSYILSENFFDLRNELIQLQIRLETNLHWLLFDIEHTLQHHWPGKASVWERQILPEAIRTTESMLPTNLKIRMTSGNVTFLSLDRSRARAIEASIGRIHGQLGLIRLGTDGVEHQRLLQNIKHFIEARLALIPYCVICFKYGHSPMSCPESLGWDTADGTLKLASYVPARARNQYRRDGIRQSELRIRLRNRLRPDVMSGKSRR